VHKPCSTRTLRLSGAPREQNKPCPKNLANLQAPLSFPAEVLEFSEAEEPKLPFDERSGNVPWD
jgi:hypothetical protein